MSESDLDWSAIVGSLRVGRDLTADEGHTLMRAMLAGEVNQTDVAELLLALKAKGETSEEIAGMLRAVREVSTAVTLDEKMLEQAIDIVGTGGDNSHSVNVSTMTSFVVAGAGVPVCKHGNRAASSKCGTADVLEALGASIELTPEQVVSCVRSANFGFCFAPTYHPTFRYVGPIRRELGVPTVFNLLGPLANPARVRHMLVGVGNPVFVERMAHTLRDSGVRRAWVVHGHGGLDEMSLGGPNDVWEVRAGEVTRMVVDALEFGLPRASVEDLRGGDPDFNAAVVRRVFIGEEGPVRDVVMFNAASALVIAGAVQGIAEGIESARRSIDSGAAMRALEGFVEASHGAAVCDD
ncbi:MAG: anthranilate phosphoribosyltransferase [Ilumatobacteraceae bacterium]